MSVAFSAKRWQHLMARNYKVTWLTRDCKVKSDCDTNNRFSVPPGTLGGSHWVERLNICLISFHVFLYFLFKYSNQTHTDYYIPSTRVSYSYNKTYYMHSFLNLFLELNSTCFGQFLCPSSGVFLCTHRSNGICHTGLLTACEQDQDGTSWSCSQAVWHISLLCVQWKTPDDGQGNCPKHI